MLRILNLLIELRLTLRKSVLNAIRLEGAIFQDRVLKRIASTFEYIFEHLSIIRNSNTYMRM